MAGGTSPTLEDEMTKTELDFTPIIDTEGGGFEFRYHIRPSDISIRGIDVDWDSVTVGRFGKHEVEEAAGKLLAFFQSRGLWVAFTILELARFYQEKGWDPNKMFFGLSGTWLDDGLAWIGHPWRRGIPYLVLTPSGEYAITNLFIEACRKK